VARHKPITDAALRRLALERFQEGPLLEEDGRCNRMRPRPMNDPLRDTVAKFILADTGHFPADRREDVVAAVYGELDLYRVDKILTETEGPANVAQSLRVQVEPLKPALRALAALLAVPHRNRIDPSRYDSVIGLLQGIINAEEAEIARQEEAAKKSERGPSRRTELRDSLARGFKDIAVSRLGKTECEAEAWVANLFDTLKSTHPELKLRYPNETHRDKFKAMFASRR